LEQEILLLREQLNHLSSLLKTPPSSVCDSTESEILRGKFDALTKINTTLRNENKSLNFRLKHEFVPLADYDKLANKLKKLEANPPAPSVASMALPPAVRTLPQGGFGTLFPLPETSTTSPPQVQSARVSLPSFPSVMRASTEGRKSLTVDMKPLDLENLRPTNSAVVDPSGKFPARHTARQTARLQAEEEERRMLEKRVAEASEGVLCLTKEEAVDFACKVLESQGHVGGIPKVHAMRIFRSVCGEEESIQTSTDIREFARLILQTSV
jgi:hypothetical protein